MSARETGTIKAWADGVGVIRPHHTPRTTGDATFSAADVVGGEPAIARRCAFTLEGPSGERRALNVRVWPC